VAHKPPTTPTNRPTPPQKPTNQPTNQPTDGQTKEDISAADLVPNLNLKRLIYDLVEEGGQGLACKPTNAEEAGTETAFGFEEVMVLRCLGPAESDWMGKAQVVTKEGVAGGRRRSSAAGREAMVFQDTTVSRRHFEAGWGPLEASASASASDGSGSAGGSAGGSGRGGGGAPGFYIQDLGSAGGTYLRLRHREALALRDGAMILVGKHQFIVLAPGRLGELMPGGGGGAGEGGEQQEHEAGLRPPLQQQPSGLGTPQAGGGGGGGGSGPDESAGAGASGVGGSETKPASALIQAYLAKPRAPLVGTDGRPQLALKCFAPEGSPMQHRVFLVGPEGATVGRKQSNTVSLSQEKNGEVLGLDSAVSGEHCRILYEPPETGGRGFVVLDGGPGGDKASTNGTWARLSYMQMASPRQPLERDDEILVGGILRFQVAFDQFLMELPVPPSCGMEEGEGEEVVSDGSGSSPRSSGRGQQQQQQQQGPKAVEAGSGDDLMEVS
jgi:pSer/pThr/pTyr-binding forkhead associated (FHA) protein